MKSLTVVIFEDTKCIVVEYQESTTTSIWNIWKLFFTVLHEFFEIIKNALFKLTIKIHKFVTCIMRCFIDDAQKYSSENCFLYKVREGKYRFMEYFTINNIDNKQSLSHSKCYLPLHVQLQIKYIRSFFVVRYKLFRNTKSTLSQSTTKDSHDVHTYWCDVWE